MSESRRPGRAAAALVLAGGSLLLAAAAIALALILDAGEKAARPPVASALARTRKAASVGDFRRGFRAFSQTNVSHGRLHVDPRLRYRGQLSAHAAYDGSGENGFARAIFNVDWYPGDNVRFGAAYYLPAGFLEAMQGQVAILRWDDFPGHPSDASHGGIVIEGHDRSAYLVRDYLGDGSQTALTGRFALPEGRWFSLQVRQHLSSGPDARSKVYLDGQLVATSSAPNLHADRTVLRIRYGLVAIASGAQRRSLELWFARPYASPGRG